MTKKDYLEVEIKRTKAVLYELETEYNKEIGVEPDRNEKPEKEVGATKSETSAKKAADKKSGSYDGMTSKELYKLCCERGLSSKCKSRSKESLIAVLTDADNGTSGSESKKTSGKKADEKAADKKKAASGKKEPEDADDWDDEDDPYSGKGAKELYQLCLDAGIDGVEKMKSREYYIKLLEENKKSDDSDDDWGDEEEDGDEWEV